MLLAASGHASVAGSQQPRSSVSPSSASPQRALLDQYCVSCHNARARTADLALDAVDVTKVGDGVETWEKVLRKLRARAMPPPGLPRPDERTYTALVSYLETSLDDLAAARPNPGRTDTFRRLNRTEYQHAIRDLLSLETDVTAVLPSDDVTQGFDNISVGGLSPTLLERYLVAASKISRAAVGSPISVPGADPTILSSALSQEVPFEELPMGTRGGLAVRYNFPLDAEYVFQIRLARNSDAFSVAHLNEEHDLELTLDGQRLRLFTLTPAPHKGQSAGNGQTLAAEIEAGLTLRIPVKAGPQTIGVTFVKKPSLVSGGLRQRMVSQARSQPAVYSVIVTGPFDARGAGDTPSRRRIFVCRPHAEADEARCARTILSTLARRAYRRPVVEGDLSELLRFYTDARARGESFDQGIEKGLRRLLVSPDFLFRIERDPQGVAPNTAYRVSDLELASRLSMFLWSSIPDDELLDAAARGELRKPAVLAQQTRRMLADARSDTLITNFAAQWLRLRNLSANQPDPRAFPNFAEDLRQAFRRETELFFESVVREDRSVLDLLRANYTFVNERLAKHYGIPNVYGSRFQRVTFDEGSVRGGLLGQGSILMGTSYPNRTSPVSRGKWILDNLLGTPPPPPPPNVPPLEDSSPGGKVLSMRERMAKHRANPVCAGCHRLMDPLGLSLENFDAVGNWRTDDGGARLDVSGSLPDGTQYEGVKGLRQALLSRPDLVVGTLTEKLLTYGLGRALDQEADAPAVRAITRDAARNDYRFSSIILAIVNSVPFEMRRSASSAEEQVSASRP